MWFDAIKAVTPPRTHTVTIVSSRQQFNEALSGATDKLAVFMFHAPGCKACKVAIPRLPELAHEFKQDVEFYSMDIYEDKELAQELGIEQLPTFHIYVMHDGKPGMLSSFTCGAMRCVGVLRKKLKFFSQYDASKYEF